MLDLALGDFYRLIGNHYTEHAFSQFNTLRDETQVFYFEAMGGRGTEAWTAGMQQSISAIAETTDNFRYFLAPGADHCILPFPTFYTETVGDVRFVDWLRDLVGGVDVPSVACPGCLD